MCNVKFLVVLSGNTRKVKLSKPYAGLHEYASMIHFIDQGLHTFIIWQTGAGVKRRILVKKFFILLLPNSQLWIIHTIR